MYLVTGAAGQCGRQIVQAFVRNGVPVRALIRDPGKANMVSAAGVEVVVGDMSRPETLGAALDGITGAVLNSSADPHMGTTQTIFIAACRTSGVEHVVKISGAEPDFDPNSFIFTRMHEAIEDTLEASGLGWTHLRPSQFMQVYLREARSIREEGIMALPFADIELAPVDLADIGEMAFRALIDTTHRGQRYDVTGPEALTLKNIASQIATATGRTVQYIPISIEARSDALRSAGTPEFMVEALEDQARERLRRKKSRTVTTTHEAFGLRPTTFAEFVARHANDFC